MIRRLVLVALLCPCGISASTVEQQVRDEWLVLVSFGAPGTTKTDMREGMIGPMDLVVRSKPPIRHRRRRQK